MDWNQQVYSASGGFDYSKNYKKHAFADIESDSAAPSGGSSSIRADQLQEHVHIREIPSPNRIKVPSVRDALRQQQDLAIKAVIELNMYDKSLIDNALDNLSKTGGLSLS